MLVNVRAYFPSPKLGGRGEALAPRYLAIYQQDKYASARLTPFEGLKTHC